MYSSQLGDAQSDLQARWDSLLQQMKGVNIAITANRAVQPQTADTARAITALQAKNVQLKAQADAISRQIQGASLTPAEKLLLSGGTYAGQVVDAGGAIIRDTVKFAAGTAGDAAGAVTKPLILPLLAIAVGLYIVGKSGIVTQAGNAYKPWK